jgi:hypothetical protein
MPHRFWTLLWLFNFSCTLRERERGTNERENYLLHDIPPCVYDVVNLPWCISNSTRSPFLEGMSSWWEISRPMFNLTKKHWVRKHKNILWWKQRWKNNQHWKSSKSQTLQNNTRALDLALDKTFRKFKKFDYINL